MTDSPDTRVRRLAEKSVADPEALQTILNGAAVAHIGVVIEDYPYVMPVACAPWRREGQPTGLLFHGSTGSRLFRAMAAGARVCATVTLLDGLVMARSAFESSMNYRCAMIMGTCVELTGQAKAEALEALTDHLLPGRRQELRATTAKEYAATMVLGLASSHWSVKASEGGPEDPPEDIAATPELWAGAVPLVTNFGKAQPDEFSVRLPTPGYVRTWVAPGGGQ